MATASDTKTTAVKQGPNTSSLKKFAQNARRLLLEQVESKLAQVLADGSLARRESSKAVTELEEQIAASSRDQVIERVAYTWFNRFCALRFMDVNRFTRIGTVSPSEGFQQPEILMEAKQGHIDDDWKVDKQRVLGLLDGTLPSTNPQQEAYRVLLVAVCNSYHSLMPFMFEKIADYTELLIPDDLLSDNSVLTEARNVLTPEACQDVEVIGWLYQFYISEKKDDVFAALKKGKKITPENIPAATQLFTPHWIVRYLVDNSLGRLWMLNHPDSRLVEQMDYYIRPEEPETDFLRIGSPEEIKICDPACGSGHMLTYAFDLLYAIYEEQGYQATDIPRLILTHNLYGIEIDQRAGALAAFALTMKAREKYKRFLNSGKVVQPNICVLENIQIDPEDLSAYMDKVGRDLFTGGLQGVVNQWEEADNFGSLIRPLVTDVSEVLELLRERQMGEDLFLAGVHQKVLKALRQADYLSPKYHVVVANPPYMGSGGMNKSLKSFVTQQSVNAKSDVFSAFILRVLSLTQKHAALVTPYVWMFISSFEELRDDILSLSQITSLIQLEYNAFEPACVPVCCFTLETPAASERQGTFIRLSEFKGHENQAPKTLEAIGSPSCTYRFSASSNDFREISGKPIAYWASNKVRNAFRNPPLKSVSEPRAGITTGDNDRFVRRWFEVSRTSLALDKSSPEEVWKSTTNKWVPLNSGGVFRKWAGNYEKVIRFDQIAYEQLKAQGNSCASEDRYFNPCLTWSAIGSTEQFGVRRCGDGFVFTTASHCLFATSAPLPAIASLLCSSAAAHLSQLINPTLNANPGDIAKLPFPFAAESQKEAIRIAEQCIAISEQDWNAFETSWDFETPPAVRFAVDESLQATVSQMKYESDATIDRMTSLERENNQLVAGAFDLMAELETDVSRKQVSLTCNPYYRYGGKRSDSELEALLLADTMREFISYAVGCMLGRYSLDKPGLILANQGDTADDYRQQIPEPTFAPDEDNVIPLLDGDWFEDDISERFKEFLKVTFGTEHYEENLTFLENALYPDNLTGKKRKTIRDYFLRDFYNHHIKLYKKRPIYWLFSSPKGTFNALIYMHRYRPDTVSTVLGYLRDFIVKLNASVEHLQSVADGTDASKSEKAKALKEITALKKDIKELNDYEHKVLFPLASKQIAIDLDDGVKVNYNKFGNALKKVTGLTGK